MAIVHLVARAVEGRRPLADADAAAWLFRKLRAAWPEALAACLMPNHLHLIVRAEARAARRRLASVVSGFARRGGEPRRTWERVPEAVLVPNRRHLERQVRYILLNPCREGLARDPLAWRWSTHRGIIGAEYEPWVPAARMAEELGRAQRGFAKWFHGYVSGDPSVHPGGSPFPAPAPAREVAALPLESIVRAAAVATVWGSAATRRHATCLLARHQGWRNAARVALAIGISQQQVRRLWNRDAPELLRASALCLGDPRLH